MEGEGAAGEGSRNRRRSRRVMDLNMLYLGLPPLAQPPGQIMLSLDCPVPRPNSGRSAGGTGELRGFSEVLAPPAAAYSPSNALSTPDEVLIDPVAEWLVDPVEPVEALETPSYGGGSDINGSSARQAPVFRPLEHEVIEVCDRLSHNVQVTSVIRGVDIVNAIRPSAVEAMSPELRLRRLIQVSDQHRIGRPGQAQANGGRQRENSPEADILLRSIQRSHDVLALRRQTLGGDGSSGDAGRNGNCGCNSSFDCHICLEPAKEPVVTPCGHLFCWSCLYQWLRQHSAHSECPVCKGEVLETNVTPIYVRGGGEMVASNNEIPPRPRARRTESFRQQLQMQDPRGIVGMVRRLIENQELARGGHVGSSSIGFDVNAAPTSWQRVRPLRQQRQEQNHNTEPSVPEPQLQVVINVDAVDGPSGIPVPYIHSNPRNAALAAALSALHSRPVEQASTSGIIGETSQGRRSRPSEPTATRRTRRRQQQE
ncbi:hypothetical protein GUJ93_ZPchr0008g11535 [Zizania palustris]|uniref:E3 ubiquitin-protein ligase RMA n=1 Tax=Zizania palustris TaxID=103762 RepID=A0A8J5RGY1_ZIZPA|nr:hypothetical protein GUJ93_ZPchr0008g11535 [Zizania palustris]